MTEILVHRIYQAKEQLISATSNLIRLGLGAWFELRLNIRYTVKGTHGVSQVKMSSIPTMHIYDNIIYVYYINIIYVYYITHVSSVFCFHYVLCSQRGRNKVQMLAA